ncbi:MAG: type IIL restriction-modification enzyme MmeI, partial [Verrucomicrobiota bacterium]
MDAAPPLSIAFAISDHPWVDSTEGAAVRIAMTVAISGAHLGELASVISERPQEDGSGLVTLSSKAGKIQADLTVGAEVSQAAKLKANEGICFQGMNLVGEGFRVTPEAVKALGLDPEAPPPVIRRYQKGRELVQGGESGLVIDCFGLTEDQLRDRYPRVYQHLLTHVKPERDQNNRASRRKNWWLFGEPVGKLRSALAGLRRYIATLETSKFKPFVFIEGPVVPDHKLYAIASDDALVLGILNSRVHNVWALSAGGYLGVGNDPTWTNTTTFLPFPFPVCGEQVASLVRDIAERLDAHRKRVQAERPELTLTGMYNVLEKLRTGEALNEKEKQIHDAGLVSVLRQLHDDLD